MDDKLREEIKQLIREVILEDVDVEVTEGNGVYDNSVSLRVTLPTADEGVWEAKYTSGDYL